MRNSQPHLFIYFLTFVLVVTELKISCYAQAPSSIICPSSTSISPCACKQYIGNGFPAFNNSIKIDCKGKNLGDFQVSNVLNAFLAPGLSPIKEISAAYNQITKVPKQVSKFPALLLVDFSSNRISEITSDDGKPFMKNNPSSNEFIWISFVGNQIRHIPSGVFYFPSVVYVTIDFMENQIVTISPDAFRFPLAKHITLTFYGNQISSLPDGVFNFPLVTNGVAISLQRNKLRVIPSASVFNFPSANSVYLGLDYNMITSIQQNAFSFTFYATGSVGIDLVGNSISTIPCGTFNYPLPSNSVNLKLSNNKITTIPSCAFNFPSAKYIYLELNNNSISAISPGLFNFPLGEWVILSLGNNQISTIPPNTFAQGRFSEIKLENNKLKRLDSTVFKTPLTRPAGIFISSNINIDIRGNPIDCLTDPCHLAWLLKGANSSQLLSKITANGVCSSSNGGSPFSTLNSFDFGNNCICSYN